MSRWRAPYVAVLNLLSPGPERMDIFQGQSDTQRVNVAQNIISDLIAQFSTIIRKN